MFTYTQFLSHGKLIWACLLTLWCISYTLTAMTVRDTICSTWTPFPTLCFPQKKYNKANTTTGDNWTIIPSCKMNTTDCIYDVIPWVQIWAISLVHRVSLRTDRGKHEHWDLQETLSCKHNPLILHELLGGLHRIPTAKKLSLSLVCFTSAIKLLQFILGCYRTIQQHHLYLAA